MFSPGQVKPHCILICIVMLLFILWLLTSGDQGDTVEKYSGLSCFVTVSITMHGLIMLDLVLDIDLCFRVS